MYFFETIQRAAIEKVHSSAIAWLFSESNQSLLPNQKRKLISDLTKIQTKGKLVRSITEYKDIDILIEYEDLVVAIENKIKISEHHKQLKKYGATLRKDFVGKPIIKIFLTLIGEKASINEWLTLTYDSLLEKLKSLRPSGEIICDYISNLDLLVNCKNEFLKNHLSFPNVFCNGSMKKHEKAGLRYTNPTAQYISDNNLETILQRAFLLELKNKVNILSENIFINETRGNALLDYKNPTELQRLELAGEKIDIGIQFQGNTLKIQFENGYDSNGERKSKNPNLRSVLDKNIPDIFQKLDLKTNGWRINPPKSKSSEYYSFSKKIPFNNEKTGLAENSFYDCVNALKNGYEECKTVYEDLRSLVNDNTKTDY